MLMDAEITTEKVDLWMTNSHRHIAHNSGPTQSECLAVVVQAVEAHAVEEDLRNNVPNYL